MKTIITLDELVRNTEIEGTVVAAGSFDCMTDFLNYFDVHYKPILEQLAKDWAGASDAKRFMASDLLAIFNPKSE